MTELLLLTQPDCPLCEKAKIIIKKIKKDFPGLKVKEVSLREHPGLIEKYGIMATPAFVINGRLEYPKEPVEGKLREILGQAAE